jgi:amino acid transporter
LWIVALIALLVAVSSVGGAAVYLSSTSRLPFVAGIDSYLPRAFGRVHARWGTPWISIIVYGIAGMLCALLSQAGSSVEAAYDFLVSMSVITYFIPFAFLFLSMIALQREPAPPQVVRLPGGKPLAIVLAAIGLITTVFAIVLSVVPADDDPHKGLSVAKILGSTILMIGAGALVFWNGRRRQRATAHFSKVTL